MTKTIRRLRDQLKRTDKCPVCRTQFSESLHPFDVAVREEFKKRRSKAAKKGWKTRKDNERFEKTNPRSVLWY